MNSIDTVSKLRRAQIHLHTIEGEVVTSIRMEYEGVDYEMITVLTLVHLFGHSSDFWNSRLKEWGTKIIFLHGQQWVNVVDILPLFGLTVTLKGDMI